MSTSPASILHALSPADTEDTAQRQATVAEIDASCRNTLLLLFGGGLFWLLLGTVFAVAASWKMHDPEFLGDVSWLTFGRIRPVRPLDHRGLVYILHRADSPGAVLLPYRQALPGNG